MGSTMFPSSANRAFILGLAMAALISFFSLSTISVGVFLGARYHAKESLRSPARVRPRSARSACLHRVAIVTAKGRSFLALMCSCVAKLSSPAVKADGNLAYRIPSLEHGDAFRSPCERQDEGGPGAQRA